jgi:hypothetical protein
VEADLGQRLLKPRGLGVGPDGAGAGVGGAHLPVCPERKGRWRRRSERRRPQWLVSASCARQRVT